MTPATIKDSSSAASPGTKKESPRLVAIDILRGVAALSVLFTHIPRIQTGSYIDLLLQLPLEFGSLGVPMFIVISGFCIHLGYARKIKSGDTESWKWTAFWKRRFVRLYPTYLAAIVVSCFILFTTTHIFYANSMARECVSVDLARHILMIQNITIDCCGGLGNPPFWTLALEEQLYALFGVIVLLRNRYSATKILYYGMIVTIAWRFACVWVPFLCSQHFSDQSAAAPITLGTWQRWPFGWWFLWLLGAVAAEVHVGLICIPEWCRSWKLILVSGVITLFTYPRTLGRYTRYWLSDQGLQGWVQAGLNSLVSLSELIFALGCFVLLLRMIKNESTGSYRSKKALFVASIGTFSYSLYLTHYPVIDLLSAGFGMPCTVREVFTRLILYSPLCIAIAWVFFQAFEQPFLRKTTTQSAMIDA